MPTAAPSEALTAARFSITIDGHELATFSELLSIVTEVQTADALQSTDGDVLHRKLLGMAKPPTVVLKRGQTAGLELWAWHEAALTGDVAAARKTCMLVMFNVEGRPVARYHLEQAWPSKLEIGALRSGTGSVLSETVTLVCERLQRVSV